ncbi:Uncharacterised protein [Salmonella enterica subsp. enterica serovar Bovismorbificans]|uniref:Uncharacterized protein n=1 Tax=Salmonella enterica subsp. enterica serovar Bovismorbificans TaxID=58097 RepID=A0A655EMJ6_SALET|nr:Uncharacterised protein [Salmonella enterica subsp. enterica serovar Bovismorbificans]CNV27519.1 Uncharacterised protein [Salmonella enterica subsp. enterica serovar Bovismorbificans]
MRFLPLAGSTHFTTSAFIQRQLNFVQAARKILFSNIAELEARQCRDSVAQRTQEKLPLQGIAVSRRAIQVIADNGEFHLIRRRQRCFLRRQVERHPLRHKVFHMEIPTPQQIIAGVGADMPQAGRRVDIQRIIQTV